MYIFLTVWQTDTASVLMEAIGYINFPDHRLLDSLTIAYVMQTLSGPYMKSSKHKKARTTQQRVPTFIFMSFRSLSFWKKKFELC